MTLSELFTHNYEYLNTVAKRITRCKDYRMAPELLSTTYLTLFEKQTIFPQDNEEFVKWFSKCMKNYFTWPNSDFNKAQYSKECLSLDNDFNKKVTLGSFARRGVPVAGDSEKLTNSFLERLIDEDSLKEIETLAESTNDFTKELIEISSSLGKVKTLRYIEVVEFKRLLPEYEKILFELYFEKDLSTRDIAALYSDEEHKMNYQSVNQMVNVIKSKIDKHQWKQSSL